jgi:hypothetical protein
MDSERVAIFRYRFWQKRFVFNDSAGNYYFIYLDPSEFGFFVEVAAFDAAFEPLDTENVKDLANFLRSRDLKFFTGLGEVLDFPVPKRVRQKLSERFAHRFLQEIDREFIFRLRDAKHWIIDFGALRRGEWRLREPKLFPWRIAEVDVVVTEDGELLYRGGRIDEGRFWELYDEYLRSLRPKIARKDRICKKIEADLLQRFEVVRVENAADVEKEARVDICAWDMYEPLLRVDYRMADYSECSLGLYGIDMEVSYLLWRVIDAFGLEAVENELYYWSEVEVVGQKFFRF